MSSGFGGWPFGAPALEYGAEWRAAGQALSEDLPLQAGEFLPVEPDAAAGAVDGNAGRRIAAPILDLGR